MDSCILIYMSESPETKELSIEEQLAMQQHALTKIYKSVEQTRKIMLWTGIVTIAMFVLPLIGILIVLPRFINTITSTYSGLL